MFAFVVEDVLLLPIQLLDRKAVDRQLGVRGHPLLNGRQRNAQQLRIEPRRRLAALREQNLHLLAFGVDFVVALVLVVLQRREVPDQVFELADLVGEHERAQGACRGRSPACPQRGVLRDLLVERVVGALPRIPVGKDVREIPFEAIGNLGRSRSSGAAVASVGDEVCIRGAILQREAARREMRAQFLGATTRDAGPARAVRGRVHRASRV